MYENLARWYDQVYPHAEYARAFSRALPVITERFGDQTVRVLDLCCGTARALGVFATLPKVAAYGVDSNPVMLERARHNLDAVGSRAKLLRRDVLDLCLADFDVGDFHIVLMTGASLLHFKREERARVFQFAQAVLNDAGLFMLDVLPSDSGDRSTKTEATLRRSFVENEKSITVVYVREHEVTQGHHHSIVLIRESGEMKPAQVLYDYIPFYPVTPDMAYEEATAHGLGRANPLPIDYSHSTFLFMTR